MSNHSLALYSLLLRSLSLKWGSMLPLTILHTVSLLWLYTACRFSILVTCLSQSSFIIGSISSYVTALVVGSTCWAGFGWGRGRFWCPWFRIGNWWYLRPLCLLYRVQHPHGNLSSQHMFPWKNPSSARVLSWSDWRKKKYYHWADGCSWNGYSFHSSRGSHYSYCRNFKNTACADRAYCPTSCSCLSGKVIQCCSRATEWFRL